MTPDQDQPSNAAIRMAVCDHDACSKVECSEAADNPMITETVTKTTWVMRVLTKNPWDKEPSFLDCGHEQDEPWKARWSLNLCLLPVYAIPVEDPKLFRRDTTIVDTETPL